MTGDGGNVFMSKKIVDYFKNKKVLILGYGREGKTTFSFLRKHYPEMIITIADKNIIAPVDENTRVICGEKYLDTLGEYDIVMQSPGISLRDVTVPDKTEISGQMDLFLRFADCIKVGITGTKGKTTTTTLIYNMIKESGKKCFLLGNIGTPVFESLDEIEDSISVIEMSCHQLEFSKASPHISVITNIYPEHLDHYNGFEGYYNAKLNIVKYQNKNDYLIYNKDQGLDKFIDIQTIKSKLVPVSVNDYENNEFLKSLININDKLTGEHYKQDIFFMIAVAEILKIDSSFVKTSLEKFKGIEHRLEKVGTFKGITFYNDSIATIPHAVILNVKALGNVNSLIFGGLDRGIDYSQMIDFLFESDIENLIGLPETGYAIIDELKKRGCKKKMFKTDTMDEAVRVSFENGKKGTSCLFSPAASSYNRYKNFEEKGRHFKCLCKTIGEE